METKRDKIAQVKRKQENAAHHRHCKTKFPAPVSATDWDGTVKQPSDNHMATVGSKYRHWTREEKLTVGTMAVRHAPVPGSR